MKPAISQESQPIYTILLIWTQLLDIFDWRDKNLPLQQLAVSKITAHGKKV